MLKAERVKEFNEECVTKSKDKLVKITGDNQKKIVFKNPDLAIYKIINLDNCEIKNQKSADNLVEYQQYQVIIEFKGTDVDEAFKQIAASYNYLKNNNLIKTKVVGVIVSCDRTPKATLRKAKNAAAKNNYKIYKKKSGEELELKKLF